MIIKNYRTNPWVYWFLWVFVVTYVVLVTVWVVIFVQNTSPVHTWFKTPGLPGASLTSLRGSFTIVVLRIAIIVHVWVPFVVMFMIAYRKNAILSTGAFAVIVTGFVLCFFAFTVLSDEYTHCNGQEQYGNLCNDPQWCCVTEIWSNPANMCPNTIDCDTPLTVDDVSANQTFLGLYWMHFVMTLLQALYAGVVVYSWYMGRETDQYKEKTKDPEEVEEIKTPPPVSTVTQQLVSGLTRRRATTHRLKE